MNFKLERTEDNYITVSVEHDGLVIVADFSRHAFKENGYVDAENVKFINDIVPKNSADLLAKMMQSLGHWVVKNHSKLIN